MRQDSNWLGFQGLFNWISRLSPAKQAFLIVIIHGLAGLALKRFAAVFASSWQISPWYPPAALDFVLLLGFGLRYTPALLAVPLIDGLVIERIVSPEKAITPIYVVLCALGIMFGYSAACALLKRRLKIDPRLYRLRDVTWFAVVTIIASLAVAMFCVTTLALEGQVPWSKWGIRVMHYWAGDATGVIMLAVPLLILSRLAPWSNSRIDITQLAQSINLRLPTGKQVLGWSIAIIALTIASWAAYGGLQSKDLDYTYFIFLPLVWIAAQQGFEKAALAVLFINISSVIFIGGKASGSDTLALQFGLMAVSFTGILLGSSVNERRYTEKQLNYDATHDRLTGLHNRAWFVGQLEQAVERAKQSQDYRFALLFLDLDRFKVINDTLGHSVGDQLLVAIAARLEACLRAGDISARFGGDEFMILLDHLKSDTQATRLAERLIQELGQTFHLGEYQVFTTLSVGIATATSTKYEQAEDLLRDADIAMYRAKSQQSQYAVFDSTMYSQLVERSQLENDLRQAIAQELELYYQPIISLTTGTITGFEALLRWQHPTRGFISPSEFIPVAEDTGMITSIGRWVLREACRQMCAWQAAFPQSLTVSVNISGQQFIQPDLVEQIEQILQITGFAANRLKLEITESVLIANAQEVALILEQLKALGVKFAIDDFGTGYSSLSRLYELRVDTLKIDRSFIERMNLSEGTEIVQAIIALAHSLNIQVTAEGVETEAQLATLRTLRCDEGQGYFFARPQPSQIAQNLLASPPWSAN